MAWRFSCQHGLTKSELKASNHGLLIGYMYGLITGLGIAAVYYLFLAS